MKPSLQDIAQRAGVSTATVSRALNDRAGVNPDTREQILSLAREMGYMPSMAARSLATSRTYNLGMLTYKHTPQPIGSYHVQIAQGIDYEAQARGYHVITRFVDDEMMSNGERLPLVAEQRTDGLILVGPALKAPFIIELYNSGVPIVLVDNLLNETKLDAVVCDNIDGTHQITRHLIETHGLERLVFLSGPAHWFSSRERCAGYESALALSGLKPRVGTMPDTTVHTGYAAMLRVLDEQPDVQGVVAVNDATAVGAIRACKERGRRVPEDVAVVGFDNVAWGPLHDPPLTTVGMFKYETGVQAARRLIDVIERGSATPFQLRLGVDLVIRRSCGCLPAEHSLFPHE
ncbi:LacI family DNA-binding transcriptional regulator [Aggregatilinea lenta]|uniref:LacI family DNA-binding transcriptional regulator n=1 Tax=Aggregatilinea lenta TaxID=913108 RepID=UPI000E5BEB7A|nr:LacI family DNA-binding transcriptional regulator [Aggregatilinea lenta]